MMDVTVKTLDGQNRNYSLPENITVKEFKERIANSINIPSDTQRLIFHGKVMADEKMLKDYDVHGKVIHVVQRAPPSARTTDSSSSSTASGTTAGPQGPNSVLVGSFTLPSEVLDANQVQNIVQQAVAGMGDNWRNARVSTRASTDGSSLDVHINLGQVPSSTVSNGAQQRLNQAKQMLGLAREAVNKLDNPPNSQESDESQDENRNRETTQAANDSTEDSDMDTSSPNVSRPDADQSEDREEVNDNESPEASSQETPPNQATNGAQRRDSDAPRLSAMSDLLGDVMELNDRLLPHVDRLRELMSEDAELPSDQVHESQRTFNLVSEAMHALGHGYHNLSDLIVNMSTPPPRHLSTTPTHPLIPGMPHQAIPVRAQFSVGSPRVVRRTVTTTQPRPEGPTTQAGTAATTVTTSSASTTQANPSTTQTTSGSPQNVPPGFVSTASTNPYVYVEVGPDSVTVNSISAHVIATENSGDRQNGRSTDPNTTVSSSSTTTSTASSTTAASSTPTSTTTSGGATPSAPPPPIPGLTGMNIPGLPPDMMQNIISSVLQQHGHRQGQPVQINVIPVPISSMGGGQLPGLARLPNPGAMPNIHASASVSASAPTGGVTSFTSSTSTVSGSASTTASASATATASASVSSTSSTPTSTTTSTSTLPGAQAPRFIGPMVIGDGGMQRPVDPFLPCSSHHFLAQRTRSMATQTNQAPENALSDMVSSLMSGLLGGAHQAPPRTAPASVAPGGPTSTRPTQGTPSSRATTNTTSSQPGPIPANPFASLLSGGFGPMAGGVRLPGPAVSGPMSGLPMMQMLRDMLQTAQPSGAGQPTQGQGQNQDQSQPQGAMSDDAFARLVSGIGTYFSRAATGQQAQDTVHDFLSTLGDSYTSSSEESFINDVFQCLSRHVTFSDLLQIFFGNPVPLNRLRTPLQEFIRDRVLNGAEYNDASMEAGVDRIIRDMQTEIDEAVAVVTVKDDIDLKTTLRNLFRKNLLKITKQIMESPVHDAEFGQHLYTNVRRLLEEFVVLTPDCLVEGLPAFETMLHARLRHMTAGMNPMIQQWMVSMTSQQLQSFRQNVSITQSDVQHYVVRNSTQRAKTAAAAADKRSESPMDTEDSATASKPVASKKPTIPPKPVLQDRKPKPSSTPTSSATERGKRTFMNGAGAGSDGASPSHSASPTSPPTDEDESWKGVVPADWVPIINRDINRQRENGITRPLSDVYMQGMPPKRRRMMSIERPNNLNNMAEYIPDSIKRAATAAGVQPISSVENLSTEAAEESELHSALEEEVQRVISQRLQNDSDYNSDKFPSTNEFYNNKHGHA